jgi:hypothetical protein
MIARHVILFFAMAALCTGSAAQQAARQKDDPAGLLKVFLGKWQTEATFTASGAKVSSLLECRWSPQGNYLVCEQRIMMSGHEQRQLTIYSYNSKDGDFTFSTFRDPGSAPSSGTVSVKGNLWIYHSSFEAGGKKTEVVTTNDFSSAEEVFSTQVSDDGGAHWKTVLQGKAHRIAG